MYQAGKETAVLQNTLCRKQSATLVNPTNKTLQSIACEQDSYDDIRAQFGANARLESNTLCKLKGFDSIYLMSWVDCNEFMIGPAWRCIWNPVLSMHGLTVVCAHDMNTGSSVDMPLGLGEFELTIEWEDWRSRVNPDCPNKGWVDLITAAEKKGHIRR
jgi:hypothetical protein